MSLEIDLVALGALCTDPVPEPSQVINLRFVDVSALTIDRRYQRKVSDTSLQQVRKIIRTFNWRRFGALSVVANDGNLAVIDGQHRLIAAKAIGATAVPCVVSEGGLIDQANDFVGINTSRTNVAAIDRFRARVTAKDPVAIEVAEILAELDISTDVAVGSRLSHRQTRAVTVLEKMTKSIGKGEIFTTLEMLLDASNPSAPGILTAFTIEATAMTVHAVITAGGDLDRLMRILIETDFETLQEEAKQLSKLQGGNIRHKAHERLLFAFNKGLQNRVT
ncbi:ParB N-terminal domain-containing protein [Shimia sp.]|uniref:ParB N-terminal domain-containing protein n=1 Tax=Shimia sp. TaxID=1954381 RepID=UPI003B8C231B